MNRAFLSPWKILFRLLAFAASASLAAASSPPGATPAQPDPTVLTIDGEPVSTDEYKLVMQGRLSEVFSYFHAKDGREDRLGYWKDDGQAENPIRKLRQLVIDEFRSIKTVQAFAKKEGVLDDISYAAFKEGFIKENARRAKAIENKEVIYGPTQYKEYRYYYFRLADLRQAALESFQKAPENTAPAMEIEAFHAANKEHFKDAPLSETRDQIARILQKKSFEKRLEEAAAKARVEIHPEALNSITPRQDP